MPDPSDSPTAPTVETYVVAVLTDAMRQRLQDRSRRWQEQAVRPPQAQRAGTLRRRGTLPRHRRHLAFRSVCAVVRTIVGEMVYLIGGGAPEGRNRRFALSHIQQIAMYACHVVLQLTMTDIAAAFGRDRTTVGHACARVEDRRDDRGYDTLIAAVERVVAAVFAPAQS
jgi:hypothetical protein